MARKPLIIQPPIAGLDRAWAYQSQPPFSFPDGRNVRCKDTFEERTRLASRPGHIRVLATHIGEVEATTFLVHDEVVMITDNLPDFSWYPPWDLTLEIGAQKSGSVPTDRLARMLVRFDIASLDVASVSEALLTIYFNVSQGGTPAMEVVYPRTYSVKRLTQVGWVPSEVTWNDYSTGNAWSTAGGDFTAVGAASFDTTQDEVWDTVIDAFYRTIDVTTILNDALAAGATTLNLIIADSDEAGAFAGMSAGQTKRILPFFRANAFLSEQHTLAAAFQQQVPQQIIEPSRNTYIWSLSPDDNVDAGYFLSVDQDPASQNRTLLYFDLSSVSPLPTTAILRLLDFGEGGGLYTEASISLLLQRLTTTSWIEDEAAWDKANATTDWTTPGGDVTTDLQVAHTYAPTVVGGKVLASVVEIDILDLVLDAINERDRQLHLRLSVQTDDSFSFASKASPDAAYRPCVIMTF